MEDLAPIGNGSGQGLLLHTVLAVVPTTRQVLGLMHQEVFERKPHYGAPRRQRPKAERESQVWCRSVQAIGPAPSDYTWVVVADRAADDTGFLLECRRQGLAFVVRLRKKDRVTCTPQGTRNLFATVRGWEAQGSQRVEVAAHEGQPACQAHVQVSFGSATFRVPKREAPLTVWIVHAWEADAPAGVEALECIQLGSVQLSAHTTPICAILNVAIGHTTNSTTNKRPSGDLHGRDAIQPYLRQVRAKRRRIPHS